MVKLQTAVKCPEMTNKIDWTSTVCSIGSCFSEHFINHLKELGMQTADNPSGIVYNTESIAAISEQIANRKLFTEKDFFEYQGLWKSWLHHGEFSRHSVTEAVTYANNRLKKFWQQVEECDLFIITPSSSVVYVHSQTGKIVANCHRVPNNHFARKMLTVEENRDNLERAVKSIRSINQNCNIIITLSPVRHYPGELSLNSRSKARLLEAIHQTVENNGNCTYFPSYEIMIDELRDYRFYKDDMLHPTALARSIIFQRFMETVFTPEALSELPKREKTAKRNAHRPRHGTN